MVGSVSMADWETCTLGELIDIKHGFAFKGEFFADQGPGDILLTPGNFAIGGGFQWGKRKYYNGPVSPEYVLSPGEVVVTMTDLSKQADTIGYSAIVPRCDSKVLHNQRIGKVIQKSNRADLGFIYWLMRSNSYRNEIMASVTGSTVKHTSPSKILAFKFELPPLHEQRAVANTLSWLDDKIELNWRMNETLEQMAQAIFKDWFVDFGPVRRKQEGARDPIAIMGSLVQDPARAEEVAALFPNAIGDDGLPEGWRSGTLGQLAIAIGNTVDPATLDPATPYIGLEHMPRRSIMLDSWGVSGSVSSNKTRFEAGQILFGKLRPYFHKVGIAAVDGVSSTDIVILDAERHADRSLVTCCVSSDEFVAFTDKGSDGTKMPRTSWQKMKGFGIAVAPESVRNAFESIALPMHRKIIGSVVENRTLAEARDYLLPKLISGEVRVRDAERLAEPSA